MDYFEEIRRKQKISTTITEPEEEDYFEAIRSGRARPISKKESVAQLQAELEAEDWRKRVPAPSREAVMRHQIGAQTPITPQPQKQQKSSVLDRALAALSLLGPGFALVAAQQAKKKQQPAETTQPTQPAGPPPSTGELAKSTIFSSGEKLLLPVIDVAKSMVDVLTGQFSPPLPGAHPSIDELLSIPKEKWDPELRQRLEPFLPKEQKIELLGRTYTAAISPKIKKKLQAELDKWWDEKAALYEQHNITRLGTKELIAENERRIAGATPVQRTIYQVGSELPTQLAQIAATGLSGGSLVPIGLSAAASTMAELEEQGVPYKERLLRSVASGLIEAGTERLSVPEWVRYFKGIGGDRLIKEGAQEVAQQGFKTLGQWAKNAVMQWIKGAAGEVGEELVADPLHNLADILILGEKKPIWTAKQAGETALLSGVMSLILGALGLPMQYKSYQMAKQMLTQDKMPTMEQTEELHEQMKEDLAEAGKAVPQATVQAQEEVQAPEGSRITTKVPAEKLPSALEVMKRHPDYGQYDEQTLQRFLIDDFGAWDRRAWRIVQEDPQYKNATIFMIDANSFKDANDLFGHPFGDQVLKNIIDLLKSAGIEVFRPGGDEFSFFASTPEAGRAIIESARSQNLTFRDSDGRTYVVPAEKVFSYGAETGYEAADKALYAAKEGKYTGPYGSIWREIKAEPERFAPGAGETGGTAKGPEVRGVRVEEVAATAEPVPEGPAPAVSKKKTSTPKGFKSLLENYDNNLNLLIKNVLDGYEDLEDAQDDVNTLRKTGGLRYTPEGHAVTPSILQHVINLVRQNPELSPWRETKKTTITPSAETTTITPGTRIRLKNGHEHVVREVLPNGNIIIDDGTQLGPAETSGWTVVKTKAAPETIEKTLEQKKPWEMTFAEYQKAVEAGYREEGVIPYHKTLVTKALSEGKPVPPEVLADYPDLAEKYGKKETVSETPAPAKLASKRVIPKIGGTYTVRITQSTGSLKEGQEFTGKVNRIFRVKSGAVLAELESADGTKRNIPVSKYAEWREAKEEAPIKPAPEAGSINVLIPERETYHYTTPRKGTPEREKLDADYKAWDAEFERLSEVMHQARKERDATTPYTKKREAAEKKLARAERAFEEHQKAGKTIRETYRKALLEDIVETANNPFMILNALEKLGVKLEPSAYQRIKDMAKNEALRRGLSEEEAESVSIEAPMFTAFKPEQSFDEAMTNIIDIVQGRNRKAQIPRILDEFKALSPGELRRLESSLNEAVYDKAKWDAVITEARELNQKAIAAREKARAEAEAAAAKERRALADQILKMNVLEYARWRLSQGSPITATVRFNTRTQALETLQKEAPERVNDYEAIRDGKSWVLTMKYEAAVKWAKEQLARTTVEQQAAKRAKKTKETAEMPAAAPEIAPPSGKQITPIQRTAIIAYIEKHLKAPIRNKRLLSPKAAGQFHEQTGVIRLRTPEDLQTLAHETGHNLTKMLNLDYESYDELEPLGATIYPKYSSKLKRKEGLAEFFRRYLINPAEAKEVAPKFYEAFEKRIEQDPEIAKTIREVQQMYHDYYTADAVNYVKSHIVHKQPFEQRPFLTRAEKWYTDWFDDLYPIRKAVALLSDGQASQDWVLEVAKDSYILARLARAADRAAYAQLVHGMVGPDLQLKGKSLRDILAPVRNRIEDFEAYLVARRAIELEDYGIKSGLDKDKAQKAMEELSSPEFEEAAKELEKYQDNLLDWLVESGAISKQSADVWRQVHKAYIPFYRVFGEETYVGTGKAGKYADIGAPIKSIKGSSRSVWSPIQNIVRNTYFYMTVAKHNMVAKALYDQVANAKDMGWLAEILPTPMQPDQIELTRLKKDLIDAGIPKEILEKAELERIALIFNPVRFARGKEAMENILTVRVDGEVKFIQVHPELYRALKGLDAQSGHWLITLLSRATRILKPGILLSPNFAFRNIVRDTGNRLLTTKGKIWEMPWSIIKGLYHVIGKTDKYIEAEVAGAFQSTRVSLSRDELREHAMRVAKPSLAEKFNPLRWLEYVLEVSEEASKMGEYLTVEKQKGKLAAAYAARESGLDFARAGIKGRDVNKVIAFFNAALQGPDKLVREAKANPGRFLIRGTLLTMVSLAFMAARHRDPEEEKRFEEEPRWRKDLYWITYTNDGTPIYIPKPFEAGVLFASSVERILEYQKTKDPKVFEDLMVSMAEALTPDILLTAYTPFLEAWANKSFFTGRPIVPMSEQRLPEPLQYGPRTTETAKTIGKALGVSPRKVEHLITGYTGTMGAHVMDFLDLLAGKALEKKTPLELIPGPRGFTGAPLAASASVDRLYEELSKLEKDYAAFKKGIGKAPDITRLSRLRVFADALSQLRKAADLIRRMPNMTAEAKREKLREIDLKMANIARLAYGKKPIKD